MWVVVVVAMVSCKEAKKKKSDTLLLWPHKEYGDSNSKASGSDGTKVELLSSRNFMEIRHNWVISKVSFRLVYYKPEFFNRKSSKVNVLAQVLTEKHEFSFFLLKWIIEKPLPNWKIYIHKNIYHSKEQVLEQTLFLIVGEELRKL